MANTPKKPKPLSPKTLIPLLLLISLLILTTLFLSSSSQRPPTPQFPTPIPHLKPYNCKSSPQPFPVFANRVEGLKFPFLYSLADFGSLPEKPHKNIVRMLKGKLFRRPDISDTIQKFLEGKDRDGVVVDVGANVGMASFAAAAMGFKVVAFEPVFENLQRICDGVLLNRVEDLITVYSTAASDRLGNITFHKLVGRLDNSAVSATGAKLAFKSNEEIAIEVPTIPLDDVIPESQKVLLIKIDVQGWEYHVLKGAPKLLSREKGKAPYLIYEEDERLLQASNTTIKEIREFLRGLGYDNCTRHGTDSHCTKSK